MPKHFSNIQGWFDFSNIYNQAVEEFDHTQFVEIGCFLGKSTCYLAELIKEKEKDIRIIAIDFFPFKSELYQYKGIGVGQSEESYRLENLPKSQLETFIENIRAAGVEDYIIPIKSNSHKPSTIFPKEHFSFIFIDASHLEEVVYKDLYLWWEKLENGGLYAGHDILSQPVYKAVERFSKKVNKQFGIDNNSWFIRK